MMCDWVEGWQFFGYLVVCQATGTPVTMAAVIAGLICVLCLVWMLRGAANTFARLGALTSMLAAGVLSLAAGLPALQIQPDAASGGRIVVVLDASESVRRTGSSDLIGARRLLADRLEDMMGRVGQVEDWAGAVWSFGATARAIAPDVTLPDMGPSVLGADLGPLAAQSNLENAITAALQDIEQGSGVGHILLLTDGLQTQGRVSAAITRAQQAGVAIHTLGVGSKSPAEGLLSFDIGPDQAVGRAAVIRATVQGNGQLAWGINGRVEPAQPQISASDPSGLRIPVLFGERGLNFVTLEYSGDNGSAPPELGYTLVRGPARVLVFGQATWLEGADPALFLIDRAAPDQPVDLGGYDTIVIDALAPSEFATDMPDRLLEAAVGGAGLFIVNGPLRGSEEDMQRLSDWEETVIGPVLPVNSDPVEYIAEPPKRDILIVIDTSGSMGTGNYMSLARAAANKVIDSLRPQDSITILPFSSDALTPFVATNSRQDTVKLARAFVSRLRVAGGTNPNRAIAAARSLRGNNCSLFVIGDGGAGYEQSPIRTGPVCPTTSIGVANTSLPGVDTRGGQDIPIQSIRDLGNITYQVLEPEPRTTFWAQGPLQAFAQDAPSVFTIAPPISGVALSYLRPESTDVSVSGPPLRVPVLAFRRDPDVRTIGTGVFLGVVPSGLPAGPEGWASEVLKELVGWDDTSLFDIDFDLKGDEAHLRITPLGDGPVPSRLGASILMPNGTSSGINLEPSNAPGVHEGIGFLNLPSAPSRAVLNLELGDGEVQSIPLRLPQRGATQAAALSAKEATGFGIEYQTLTNIRVATGGLDLARAVPTISRNAPLPRPWPLWPWLAGLGILLFALSLFGGGIRR